MNHFFVLRALKSQSLRFIVILPFLFLNTFSIMKCEQVIQEEEDLFSEIVCGELSFVSDTNNSLFKAMVLTVDINSESEIIPVDEDGSFCFAVPVKEDDSTQVSISITRDGIIPVDTVFTIYHTPTATDVNIVTIALEHIYVSSIAPFEVGMWWEYVASAQIEDDTSSTQLNGTETWRIIGVGNDQDSARIQIEFTGNRTQVIGGVSIETVVDTTTYCDFVIRDGCFTVSDAEEGDQYTVMDIFSMSQCPSTEGAPRVTTPITNTMETSFACGEYESIWCYSCFEYQSWVTNPDLNFFEFYSHEVETEEFGFDATLQYVIIDAYTDE